MNLALKLDRIVDRAAELSALLSEGANGEAYVRASRELAEIEPVVARIDELRAAERRAAEAQTLIDPAGISADAATAIDWFHRLDADNSKPFFLATKPEWEDAIRAPMEQLIAEAAGQFHGTVKLFRPYRDVRFSPDKRPIKTSASGYVTRAGTMGFLYCELSKDGLYAGTGLYDPAKDQLTRLREAIDDDRRGGELVRIVAALEKTRVEVTGDALATAPKGYPRDHPRIALLRMKYMVAGARLAPGAPRSPRA